STGNDDMDNGERLNEVVRRWQESRREGRTVTPEELCGGDAGLLEGLQRFLDTHPEDSRPAPQRTEVAPDFGAAPPPLPAPPPARLGGRYRLLEDRYEGGLGVVHGAWDEQVPRKVALKRIKPKVAADPEWCRRFLLEAEVTGRLEHPGVVAVYG